MKPDFGFLPDDDFSNYKLSYEKAYDADLALLLSLPEKYPRDHVHMTPLRKRTAHVSKVPVYPSQELFKQPAEVMENDSSNNPVMVMFRDSYGIYLQSFLAENFSRSVFDLVK